MKRSALALGLACLAGLAPASAQKRAADPLAGFDRWIDSAMTKAGAVGLAIAVVKNDSVIFAKGFGVKKLGDPAPVTTKTLFAIGSTSKAMTATAVGILVDEGRLGWHDKVADRLPSYQLADPGLTREVTIADLLTHRTGLPGSDDRLWMGSRHSRAEVIRRSRYLAATHGLRTTFDYYNIGFLTAGEIVGTASGSSWDTFLRERLFRPLKMNSTNTSVRSTDSTADVATPHDLRDGKVIPIQYRNIDNIGPAGSVNSTVLDMAQWIRMNLGGGTYEGRQLLTPATHREITTSHMLIGADPAGSAITYGYGWFLSRRDGFNVAEHSGGIDGMVTQLIMVPSEHVGVIVLTNSMGSLVGPAVSHAALDRILGTKGDRMAEVITVETMRSMSQRAEDSLSRARVASSRPALPLEAYAGGYYQPMYGAATISAKDGGLVFAVAGFRDSLPLAHWQFDSFRGRWSDPIFGRATASFRLETTGAAVAGVTVEGLTGEFKRISAATAALACQPTSADLSQLATRASPYDSVDVSLGDAALRICYSRPAMRGRKIFGSEIVPFDSLWRTGANDPAIINVPFPATIAGIAVQPGHYSLYTMPGRDHWMVGINGSTTQAGNDFSAEVLGRELSRQSVRRETTLDPVERFTIRSERTGASNADLILEWETTRVRIPITRTDPPAKKP